MSLFRTHDYSLRQLQYAVAVADVGGFGRAARACGVSQPSLSAQVARLEEALGLQLFERHARRVHLTHAGRALLPHLRAVLLACQAVDEAGRKLLDPASIVLRVGVIPTVAPYLLPPLTERLRAHSALPRIQWRELTTAACEAALASGDLDAILIADPPGLSSAEDAVVGFEPFALLVSRDSPLSGPISQAQAAALDLLLLEEGHCLRDQTLAYCAREAGDATVQATSLATLVQMVATDQGASVVPASAVPVETRRAAVRALPFTSPAPGRVLRLAWRARSPHAELLAELAGLAGEALAASTEGG